MSRAPNPDRGRLEILAPPDRLRAWIAAAEADGRSLSEWLRRAADAAVKRAKRRERCGWASEKSDTGSDLDP